jgi:hypothetical protein
MRFVLVIVGLAGAAGALFYGFDRLGKIEEKKINDTQIKTEFENKGRSVAEIAKLMKDAAERYVGQSAREGLSLPVGHVVTLEEMQARDGMKEVPAEVASKLVRFVYVVMDEQAPPNAVLLELVTKDTRVVIDKSGKGSLYKLEN